jgi:hypothetical protein
VSRSGVGDSQ